MMQLPQKSTIVLVQFRLAGGLMKHRVPGFMANLGIESTEKRKKRKSRREEQRGKLLYQSSRGIVTAPTLCSDLYNLGFILGPYNTVEERQDLHERILSNDYDDDGGNDDQYSITAWSKPYTVLNFRFVPGTPSPNEGAIIGYFNSFASDGWSQVEVYENELFENGIKIPDETLFVMRLASKATLPKRLGMGIPSDKEIRFALQPIVNKTAEVKAAEDVLPLPQPVRFGS